jgi:hypothetical protein
MTDTGNTPPPEPAEPAAPYAPRVDDRGPAPELFNLAPLPGARAVTAYVQPYADGGAYLTLTETYPSRERTAAGYLSPDLVRQLVERLTAGRPTGA